ncbi:MAG: bifunctional oligoribonuclease/PAP phosphatase NrnA [Candidatus Latescibacterota bacterium]|nr:MAG: bifunctional oligoribonuclease/PAP phosphatase NrnA [Candidatus Latescibacterota bacterium]
MSDLNVGAAAAQLRQAIERHDDIWVTTHESPDGDSIGAALALQIVLAGLGKRVVAIRQHPFPRQYESLPGSDMMGDAARLSELFSPQVIIACDVGSFDRIAGVLDHVGPETVVINIDHHAGNGGPEKVCQLLNFVDPSYASTTMLAYALLQAAWPGCIGADSALCLYVGLITDTGCFRFTNTKSETLRVGAELAGLGADPGGLAEQYMFRRRPEALHLLGEVLATLRFHDSGRVATLQLTHEMLRRTGARMDETEGFVNYATSVDGVHVAALLREVEPGRTRVSLRSSDLVDVARIARQFGGGGHRNAAGMSVGDNIDAARDRVLGAVLQHLQQRPSPHA